MGWVKDALRQLGATGTAEICPHGGSMRPYIQPGQRVRLIPASARDVRRGDIVLARVGGNQVLHFVWSRRGESGETEVDIGNARGRRNGWTREVFARVVAVEGARWRRVELPVSIPPNKPAPTP